MATRLQKWLLIATLSLSFIYLLIYLSSNSKHTLSSCSVDSNVTCAPPGKKSNSLGFWRFHPKHRFATPSPFVRAHAPPLPSVNFTEPTVVMLLSYQRSGSSFLGDLFNHNPLAFYTFEPLDGLYGAMYGTGPGWAVPSDITGMPDGSLREMPDWEVESVVDSLRSLLLCDHDAVPPEMLLTQFWSLFWYKQLNTVDYSQCLSRRRVSIARCHRSHLVRQCGMRFDMRNHHSERCAQMLSAESLNWAVARYQSCIAQQMLVAKQCFPLLQQRCERSPIRAVKTVRATMREAGLLLERISNLRVIHLLRDPRPVLLSRQGHSSFRATAAGKNFSAEAAFLCNTLSNDLTIRTKLEKRFPGRILQVVYDDFVRHPASAAKAIYKFLELEMPSEVNAWLTNSTLKSLHIAEAWKEKIEIARRIHVEKTCKNVFEYGRDIWPLGQ